MDERREHDSPQFGRVPYGPVDAGIIGAMTGGDTKVYLALCAHNDSDFTAAPGVRRLAALTHQQIGSVSRCLHRLESIGAITIKWAGNGHAAQYRIATVHCSANGQRKPTVHPPASGPFTGQHGTVHPPAQNRSPQRERNRLNSSEQPQKQRKHGASLAIGRGKLPHIKEMDLTDTGRLIGLYRQWRGCPTPTAIDDDLMQFAAAAVHALTAKPKNGEPIKSRAALFASMIRKGDYSMVSNADEDEARRRLNEHLHGTPAKREKLYDPTA